jgi:hypothetical protein
MRRVKRILHVAGNDLRLMVGDKAFFFWTLAFPILYRPLSARSRPVRTRLRSPS